MRAVADAASGLDPSVTPEPLREFAARQPGASQDLCRPPPR
ncbi:hypothetical protein ACWDV7_18675 [Streptomyces sp. NPDC003362]